MDYGKTKNYRMKINASIGSKRFIDIDCIFKSCNIYLKPERFRKSKFTLSKVK